MSATSAVAVTILLLIASGFFVAAEFALVGARRHRIEQAADEGKRGAKAARNGVREISLMLAGAQLGITMVVVGLGMVSEPAFHHLLEVPLGGVGLPHAAADTIALVVALGAVTFFHVVVGEMAPKSWAISHPERSALLLAPVFRGFTWLFRWLLIGLNGASNALLRLLHVAPRDEVVHVRNREQIFQLVEESRRLGLIGDGDHGLLTRTLGATDMAVREVMVAVPDIVAVDVSASADEVIGEAADCGRTRLVVRAADGYALGTVHVREALLARARGGGWTAGRAASRIPRVAESADLQRAADTLREAHSQLGLVVEAADQEVGLVSLDDVVSKLLLSHDHVLDHEANTQSGAGSSS